VLARLETQEQVDFLNAAGCDLAQGYYYARPMPLKSAGTAGRTDFWFRLPRRRLKGQAR
jgi:EAL domain-containing protein (putative c-di-GMP-specific phosphodiesterase class I)